MKIKKTLFLIPVIFGIIYFILNINADNTIDRIIKFANENQRLDKEVIKLMKFKLSKQIKNVHKIILKDEGNHLWLFKSYKSSNSVNESIAVYQLACLLGINVPPIYEVTLPINGKMVYGSIQRFIDNAGIVSYVVPGELTKKQIKDLQLHQILDYYVCNPDVGGDNYLVKLKGGDDFLWDIKEEDIIGVDKDDSFYNILNSPYDIWNDNDPYYCRFWNAYIKKEVDINFNVGFQLIDYIHSLDIKEIEQLLNPFFYGREELLKAVLLARGELRVDFEKFYRGVASKRGLRFRFRRNKKGAEKYAQFVLEKMDKIISKKKEWLRYLEANPDKKQKNIEVIFHREGFDKIRALEYVSGNNMVVSASKVLNELKMARSNSPSLYEKFALSLYIYEVEDILRERPLECFLKEPIENIAMDPDDIDICSWEYSLRTFYKLPRRISCKTLKKIDYHSCDILKHLSFIQCPIDWDERKIIFDEYKKQIGYNSLVKFIGGMLFNEITYFEKIDNYFPWKYLGKGMLYWLREEWNESVSEYQKAIKLHNDKTINFLGYRMLGFIKEHNSKRVRFGEGFGVEEAIANYREALAINPCSVEVQLNLASLYLIKQLPRKALESFKAVQKLDFKYAEENFHFKNIKKMSEYKSRQEYSEAVRVNTLSGEHHYLLGLACAVKKQNKLAKKYFNQAREFGYKVDVHLK